MYINTLNKSYNPSNINSRYSFFKMTLNTHIQNQLIHVEQRYFKNISINIDQYMNSSMQNRYVKTPKL